MIYLRNKQETDTMSATVRRKLSELTAIAHKTGTKMTQNTTTNQKTMAQRLSGKRHDLRMCEIYF